MRHQCPDPDDIERMNTSAAEAPLTPEELMQLQSRVLGREVNYPLRAKNELILSAATQEEPSSLLNDVIQDGPFDYPRA